MNDYYSIVIGSNETVMGYLNRCDHGRDMMEVLGIRMEDGEGLRRIIPNTNHHYEFERRALFISPKIERFKVEMEPKVRFKDLLREIEPRASSLFATGRAGNKKGGGREWRENKSALAREKRWPDVEESWQ